MRVGRARVARDMCWDPEIAEADITYGGQGHMALDEQPERSRRWH